MATSIRTGTPDGTSGEKIASFALQEDGSIEAPAGIALSQQIANGPSAHRSGLSSDDTGTTDMSSAGFSSSGLKALNNAASLVVWCEFANSAGSATVVPIFYDGAGTPAPLFVGPELSFTAKTQRVSSGGDYMSLPQLCDTYGAKNVKCYLLVKGTGNVDIFAEAI